MSQTTLAEEKQMKETRQKASAEEQTGATRKSKEGFVVAEMSDNVNGEAML